MVERAKIYKEKKIKQMREDHLKWGSVLTTGEAILFLSYRASVPSVSVFGIQVPVNT